LFSLIQLYAPLAPHITEEIYQLYFRKFVGCESIHQTTLEFSNRLTDEAALSNGKVLVGTIGLIRAYKSKHQLGFKVPMKKLTLLAGSPAQKSQLQAVAEDLQQFSQAASLEIVLERSACETWFEQTHDGIQVNCEFDAQALEEFKAQKKQGT
jgi:valyl-tRNA synthetase